MKRFLFATTAVFVLTAPHAASAQTAVPAPLGNNPLKSGIYLEGLIGIDVPDDIDLDFEDLVNETTVETEIGPLFGLSVGYSVPQGDLNFRVEGEFSARVSEVKQLDDDINGELELENAEAAVFAGMLNGHVDYYLLPNFAVTAGAGIGYADVDLDVVIVNDSGAGFAYQGRVGARYSISARSTIGAAYTYFATDDVTAEDEAVGGDVDYSYQSHAFHLSYGFTF